MSGSRRIHPFKHARFFLAEYSDHLGVPLMLAGVAVVLALLAIVALPVAGPTRIDGRVVGLGFAETDEGSFATASVRIADGTVRIRLPTRHGCRVGDHIQLQKWPLRWGRRIRTAPVRWPCAQQASS